MIVLLDTAPLGIVSNPKASPANEDCRRWLRGLLASNVRVVLPEIADYEVRRELLRARKVKGLARLDALKTTLEYLPLNTMMMLEAAALWAQARQAGMPTSDAAALDGDVILAAQALSLIGRGERVVVATSNVRHLELFVEAQEWQKVI